ncbi:hypothetical protein [Paludisphaera mucosa]|uniref:Uncharacterized protein n=1 Tax=Paludisphaera mucosa TaxID=3030827 RepID=A0ABT6FAA6_9BACT|nr:hypothetical protein [Paludisphaera mucosa]MDG3004457.1 hypothetical protein [Paludisphaera mucosa]
MQPRHADRRDRRRPGTGTFLGNRGVLHDDRGRIRRPWQLRRWILCVLEFRGRRRAVMTPNRYTELFFLDEATGLAAGHRPCAECRRARFLAFRDAWAPGDGARPRATAIDGRLHAERVGPGRAKRTFEADLDALLDGVFVTVEESPHLVLGDTLLAWTPGGYAGRRPRPRGVRLPVLTPSSTVVAIRSGYVPDIHPSAGNHSAPDVGRPRISRRGSTSS